MTLLLDQIFPYIVAQLFEHEVQPLASPVRNTTEQPCVWYAEFNVIIIPVHSANI